MNEILNAYLGFQLCVDFLEKNWLQALIVFKKLLDGDKYHLLLQILIFIMAISKRERRNFICISTYKNKGNSIDYVLREVVK